MARIADFELPPDLIRMLTKLGDPDEWAPQVLEEAAETFADELKKNLSAHRDTGDLITAIKPTKPKRDKKGTRYVQVLDTKAKSKTGRNALKLAELEYGNSSQPATPVVAPAREVAGEKVRRLMEDKIKELTNR